MVNSRHSGDVDMGYMLEEFVKRNNCNLIWMEPEDTPTSYPAISTGTMYTWCSRHVYVMSL